MAGSNWNAKKYDVFARHQRQSGFKLLADNYGKISQMAYPARALDLGCGTGAITKLIGHFPSFAEIIGLDLEDKMLDIARKMNTDSRISFIQGNAKLYSMALFVHGSKGAFDLVTAVATIHWWPDVQKGVENVFRALKPTGLFVGYAALLHPKYHDIMLTDIMDKDPELSRYSQLFKKKIETEIGFPPWAKLTEQKDIEHSISEIMVKAGFTVDYCNLVTRRINLTKQEARDWCMYIAAIRGTDTSLLGEENIRRLTDLFVEALEKGPNDSVIRKFSCVEFCCVKSR